MTDIPYRDWTIRLHWRGNRYRVSLIEPRREKCRRRLDWDKPFEPEYFPECGQTLPGFWGAGMRERAIEFARMRIDMNIDGTGGPLATPTEMGRAAKRLRKLNRLPWKNEEQETS